MCLPRRGIEGESTLFLYTLLFFFIFIFFFLFFFIVLFFFFFFVRSVCLQKISLLGFACLCFRLLPLATFCATLGFDGSSRLLSVNLSFEHREQNTLVALHHRHFPRAGVLQHGHEQPTPLRVS